jgi:DNA replication protein DnaC
MALSNSQYNAILREYERQQAEDRRDLAVRVKEVYEKIPEMEALKKQAGISAMERFKKILKTGDKSAVAGFPGEINEIREREEALLKINGFPPDYMEPHYACPDCRDTGFINGQKCHCFKAKIIKRLYTQSNIDRIMESENFHTFSFDYFDDTRVITRIGLTERAYMKGVLKICRDYAEGFAKKKESLIFMGNTGVGKTFLCNCIGRELIDRYFSVIYLTANGLFDCISRVRMDKTEDLSVRELYGYLSDCDCLIIDDLGTELTNTMVSSQFFNLINARLAAEKGTVISTNLSLNQLRDTYSERVTSRITSSYTIVPLYGSDIRLKKKMEA